jgi:hypothetical protein
MTPQELEFERIRMIADSVADPQDALACILLRLETNYVYKDRFDRKTAEELLTPDLKNKAMLLFKIVGASDLHEVVKFRVTAAANWYLRRIGVDAAEMKAFKATCQFDPATHNIFAGLGPDGE